MAALQIDEFYSDVTKILVNLFEVLPRRVTIYAEDISGPDQPDEYGIHSKRYQACFATMLWLAEEESSATKMSFDRMHLTKSC